MEIETGGLAASAEKSSKRWGLRAVLVEGYRWLWPPAPQRAEASDRLDTRSEATAPWSFALESIEQRMAVYDSFRGYIEHEDGLINQRLSWMLTIHGFLYATYGIVLTKQADIVSTLAMTEDGTLASRRYLHAMADEYNMLFMFTVAISVVGAGVSLLGWGSIRAAIASIKSVARTFRAQSWIISLDTTKHSEDQATGRRPMFDRAGRMVYLTKEGLLLPRMSGGTRRREALLGSAASTIIPLLLTGVWAFSIAWGYFHRINIRDVFAPLVAS